MSTTSPATTIISVSGMTCGHCVSAVSEELEALDGVEAVNVDLNAGGISTVTITSSGELSPAGPRGSRGRGRLPDGRQRSLKPSHTGKLDMSHQELLQPPGTRVVELDIEGMTCASCVNRVEKKLGKLDGVEATVNLPLE